MPSKSTQTPKHFGLDPKEDDDNIGDIIPAMDSFRNNCVTLRKHKSTNDDTSEMVTISSFTNAQKEAASYRQQCLRRREELSQIHTKSILQEPFCDTINRCARVLPREVIVGSRPMNGVVNKARKSFPPEYIKPRVVFDAQRALISQRRDAFNASNNQATPARLGQDSQGRILKETTNARPNPVNIQRDDILVRSRLGNCQTPATAATRKTIVHPKRVLQRKPTKSENNVPKEDILVLSTFGTYRCGSQPVATQRKESDIHQVNDSAPSISEVPSATTRSPIQEEQVDVRVNNSVRAPMNGLQYKPSTSEHREASTAPKEDILVLSTFGTYSNRDLSSQSINTSTSNPVEPASGTQSNNNQSETIVSQQQVPQCNLPIGDSAEANRPKKKMPTLLLITKDMVFLPS